MAGERSFRVGFQGIAGTYSEQTATAVFKGISSNTVPLESFEQLFGALENGEVDYALVPFENTSSGTFQNVLDLLLRHQVFITGEYVVIEQHCLLAHPGIDLDQITEIRSHNHVLEQCSGFLSSMKKNDVVISQHIDTAGSARMIKEQNLTKCAAIASRRAAELYGLRILQENIQDEPAPVTRYFLLSKEMTIPQRHLSPKTTIALTLKNTSGQLLKILSCFGLRDINISKIESKTSASGLESGYPWELVFFLTVDSGLSDDTLKKALSNVQEFTTWFKVLGSYPRHTAESRTAVGIFGIGM